MIQSTTDPNTVKIKFELILNKKDHLEQNTNFINHAFCALLFLLLCRLVANYFIPLNDATEARYGEIARKMLETGNWVNLLHDYGVPFWAKPPLSTWGSALAMNFLGINEFAARLPSLFFAIVILLLLGQVLRKHSGAPTALVGVLVLAGTLFFFLGAGTVMTDMALIFCTSLSTIAFWHALVYQNRFWAYCFFIGLGLGLLAKGPLALVLVGGPIFFWVLFKRQWGNLWKNFPWFKGIFLTLVISLPWYILAERRTPGFLNYFIVGEHLNRFLVPGWTGDKYGVAHHAPKGMIWVFAFLGLFPWSFVLGRWLCFNGKKFSSLVSDKDGWMMYWGLCMLWPLAFFTLASNIIYPYVFPSLTAFAVFFAELWNRSDGSLLKTPRIIFFALFSGCIFLIATFLFIMTPEWIAKTEKPVIQAWLNQHPSSQSYLVYWDEKSQFSAQFYSSGLVKAVKTKEELCRLLSNNMENYIVINAQQASQLPPDLFSKLSLANTLTHNKKTLLLLHTPVVHC